MSPQQIGEFALIHKIRNLVESNERPPGLIKGIDDDCAVFKADNNTTLLLTTDVLVENIHFRLHYFDFFNIGWKALAANLSDIAAMGGTPRYATVSIGVTHKVSAADVQELYRGVMALAERFGVAVVGGDTVSAPNDFFVSISLLGEANQDQVVFRSGAQIGDAVFVTGDLGGSKAGLTALEREKEPAHEFTTAVKRHLAPLPRVQEGLYLVEHFVIHAMIDISDGLSSEIHHICESSGVGAVIYEESIPIEKDTQAIAEKYGDDAMTYALTGGEDFELLFTAPKALGEQLIRGLFQEHDCKCTEIGEIRAADDGIKLQLENGVLRQLLPAGYDHFS